MDGLTPTLLARACRIFLRHAYPGDDAVPPAKRAFLRDDQPLEALQTPAVCQVLHHPGGALRGYAFRLGRVGYPHLKLQVVNCENTDTWVFAVDTHDRITLSPGDADAARWVEIQAANRQLKETIERAWEADGLLTFNALLRRAVTQKV